MVPIEFKECLPPIATKIYLGVFCLFYIFLGAYSLFVLKLCIVKIFGKMAFIKKLKANKNLIGKGQIKR